MTALIYVDIVVVVVADDDCAAVDTNIVSCAHGANVYEVGLESLLSLLLLRLLEWIKPMKWWKTTTTMVLRFSLSAFTPDSNSK